MAFASLDSWGLHAPAAIRTQEQLPLSLRSSTPPGQSHPSPWCWRQEKPSATALPVAAAKRGVPSDKPVRIHHANAADPHRLAISGRMADVCAELDRLLAAEET